MKTSVLSIVLLAVISLCACSSSGGSRAVSSDEAARANVNLGSGYLREGRPDAAVDALERAVDLDPRSAEAHSVLAMAYAQLDSPDLAEEHHRRATQLDPANADAQNRYAVFLCQRNRWQDAQRFFDRAIDNPRYAQADMAMTNAGVCASQANDLESAETYFRRALDANPVNREALSRMAELSYQTRSFLQGRAFLQRLSGVGSLEAPQLLLCYLIEQELGDAPAADNCADELTRQYPRSPEVRRLRELVGDAGQ